MIVSPNEDQGTFTNGSWEQSAPEMNTAGGAPRSGTCGLTPSDPPLTFVELIRKIDDARRAVLGQNVLPKRTATYFIVAVAGAIFTVLCALWPPLRSTWNSSLGFALELIGGAGYFYALKHSDGYTEDDDFQEMARYDALHTRYFEIVRWVASAGRVTVVERANMLDLFRSTIETGNRWLLGPSDKLGALPALVALLLQAPTLSGLHGTIPTIASSILVILTFGFCAMSFATAKGEVRDRRMAWILARAVEFSEPETEGRTYTDSAIS